MTTTTRRRLPKRLCEAAQTIVDACGDQVADQQFAAALKVLDAFTGAFRQYCEARPGDENLESSKCSRASVQQQWAVLVNHVQQLLYYAPSSMLVKLPPVKELAEELLAIEESYSNLTVGDEGQSLSAETPSITLGGVSFGPFRVMLRLRARNDQRTFQVLALQPNCCLTDSSCVHPHVDGSTICLGDDGSEAFTLALRQGRIADAFDIVLGVLTHYNQGEGYQPLEDWIESEEEEANYFLCGDCDRRGEDVQVSACCGNLRCESCLYSCLHAECRRLSCNYCISTCARCALYFCEEHLQCCSACDKRFCEQHLMKDCCASCLAKQEESSEV